MIPARLLEPPPPVESRYSPERRAWALRKVGKMPDEWHPPTLTLVRRIPNVLLALKEWVPNELMETREKQRELAHTAKHLRTHLAKLRRAKHVGEDEL